MYNRQKESAKITDKDPTFKARYIGNVDTFVASGKGCTTASVQHLWDNSPEKHELKRVQIQITTTGLFMKNLEKKDSGRLFNIQNISFCNVDTVVNDKIFSWIYKANDDGQFECHAVVCSNTEKAKSMALVLSRAFQIAYKEWKSGQTKVVREVVKTERKASIARMSLSNSLKATKQKQEVYQTDTLSETTSSGESETVLNGGSAVSKGSGMTPELTQEESRSKEIGVQAELS